MSQEVREEEIRREMWNSGKDSGMRSIQGEILKAGGDAMMKWLQETSHMVYEGQV